MGKSENMDFLKTIAARDLKSGRCKTTNVINLGQGHLLTLADLSSIHTFQRSSSLKPHGQSN